MKAKEFLNNKGYGTITSKAAQAIHSLYAGQASVVTVDQINELIQPHAITLERGEKAAQDVYELLTDSFTGKQGEDTAQNKVLGKDTSGQDIIAASDKLELKTNRHPNTDGSQWGWIEGCTLNICWSDDTNKFNRDKAEKLVSDYNRLSLSLQGKQNDAYDAQERYEKALLYLNTPEIGMLNAENIFKALRIAAGLTK